MQPNYRKRQEGFVMRNNMWVVCVGLMVALVLVGCAPLGLIRT
jgi:hypothetical protein